MTALRKSDLSDEIRNEIARLKGAGFHPMPLGGGDDGKAPLIRCWSDPKLTLSQILAPMHRTGSAAYGIRLEGLAVVDVDVDDPGLVAALEARFGPSPIHVKTPRGRHLYYSAAGSLPNLRGEGLPVDIKTGGRSYVVGPLSQRPDGGFYAPAQGLLGVDSLPALRASQAPLVGAALIQEGARHSALVREAIAMVEQVASPDELTSRLTALRDGLCDNPANVLDSELRGIAGWAWQQLLKGEIFCGRDSGFRINRLALDALRGKQGGSDAIALFVLLTDQYGHTPGKRFSLDHEAMRAAGLTDLSTRAFRSARRMLEGAGLLEMVSKHRAGSHGQSFTLKRLRPGAYDAENILTLPVSEWCPEGRRRRGEG
jgi:hypothetical protein